MSLEPGPGSAQPATSISRAYSGTYEECQAALERDAAELASLGYRLVSETYDVSWGAGVCIGCLSAEFGRSAPESMAPTPNGPRA
jgi:hypothetical protein